MMESSTIDFSTGFTLSSWVNWDGAGDTTQWLFSKAGSFGFGIENVGGAMVPFLSLAGDATLKDLALAALTAYGFSPGTWVHLAAVFDPANNECRLYIDSEKVFTVALPSGFNLVSTLKNLVLGQLDVVAPNTNIGQFRGSLDELVMPEACTDAHIVQYNKGLVVQPFGNVAVAKRLNGNPCDAGGACQSDYCANGICCGGPTGECCAHVGQCPGSFTVGATCNDSAGCQGTRGDAACSTFTCETNTIDDDTACDVTVESNDCGCFLSRFCDGTESQTAPACATACTVDTECDGTCTCDGGCVEKLDLGGTCDEDADCVSGICADGVCCNTTCEGLCQACDVSGSAGTCSPVPDGTDPANECTGTGTVVARAMVRGPVRSQRRR